MGWFELLLLFFFVRVALHYIVKSFKKKEPIDLSKNSDYYKKEFPELLESEPVKPEIHIHYTEIHNHLHINRGEGN